MLRLYALGVGTVVGHVEARETTTGGHHARMRLGLLLIMRGVLLLLLLLRWRRCRGGRRGRVWVLILWWWGPGVLLPFVGVRVRVRGTNLFGRGLAAVNGLGATEYDARRTPRWGLWGHPGRRGLVEGLVHAPNEVEKQ